MLALVAACIVLQQLVLRGHRSGSSAERSSLAVEQLSQPAAGVDPESAAHKAIIRQCQLAMAAKYQTWVEEKHPNLVPSDSLDDNGNKIPLSDQVTEFLVVRDQLKTAPFMRFMPVISGPIADLKATQASHLAKVKAWGFDPHRAKSLCRELDAKRRKQARDGQKKDACISEVHASVVQLGAYAEQKMVEHAREHAELEEEREFMRCMTGTAAKQESIPKSEADIFQQQKELESQIQRFGKSAVTPYNKLVECNLMPDDKALHFMESLLARLDLEVNSAMDQDGTCVENRTRSAYCPEGTSPYFKRAATPKKAATWGGATFVAGGPLGFVLGAVGGAISGIPGGPPGMAAGAAMGITAAGAVPLGAIFAPIAALAGARDIFPTCRCNVNECSRDAQSGKCAMKTQISSSNPYQGLPYPGQKCATSPTNPKACTLQLCSPQDFAPQQDHGFYGLAGDHEGAVMNCLSTQGTPGTAMSQLEKLPDGEHDNTPANRAAIYDRLQVTYDGSHPTNSMP